MDSRLFDQSLGMPNWLPDETFYSLASRYHFLSCNSVAHQTSLQLFGQKRHGYQHDFPTGLEEFSSRTLGCLGSAQDILFKHTILPFYLPFRTELDVSDVLAALSGFSNASVKFRLGILTSRFGANHPLKACPSCMFEDQTKHGVPYWHVMHQLPGTWVCIKHNESLKVSNIKHNGVGRFQWNLPTENELVSVTPSEKKILFHLIPLAAASKSLADLPTGFHFDMSTLLRTYQYEFHRQNLITTNGNLRLKLIVASYANFVAPLRLVSEFDSLPANNQQAYMQLGRLLRFPRTGTHPLRHLVLIIWLFQSWDNFWERYSSELRSHAGENDEVAVSNSNEREKLPANLELKSELIRLIIEESFSITKAANIVGIDVSTAQAWSAQAGIKVNKRPKTTDRETQRAIINSLARGEAKESIALKRRVTIQTVTRILRSTVGLQQKRSDVQHASKLQATRKAWSDLIGAHPGLGIKAIRELAPANYAWLYRNDRAWLTLKNNQLPERLEIKQKKVNWDNRDLELSEKINAVVCKIRESHPDSVIPLWKIIQIIPELKAKYSAIDKMPLTRKAIDMAKTKNRKSDTGSLF